MANLNKQWDEYVSWLAEAVTYLKQVRHKEEMEPVLDGMSRALRAFEAYVELGYEAEGIDSLVTGIRNFMQGWINDDLDRLNDGFAELRDTLNRIHSESRRTELADCPERGSDGTSRAAPVDRGIYGRGWIEPLFGAPVEGVLFVAEGFDFTGLKLITPDGQMRFCPWADITDVTMMQRSELPQGVQDHHQDTLSKSTDPNVFMGWLPDEMSGRMGVNPFVFAPLGRQTWQDWQRVFVRAGLFTPGKV
jgi:hypothetical protein